MGIDQGKYVVTLRPSIRGVVVLGFRKIGQRKRLGVEGIPYKLANYLGLMPRDGAWLQFNNVLYDFSLADLRNFAGGTPEIQKVFRKKGTVYITIDLGKV